MKHRLLTVVTFGLILLMIPFIVHAVDYTGSCGANLTWALNNEGVLTISGTGAMYNYQTNGYSSPSWLGSQSSNYPKVKIVIIIDGVTTIGNHAFDNSSSNSLTNISFPTSITSIGMLAFPGFSNQCTINYGGTEDQWNDLISKSNANPANNPGLFASSTSIVYTCTKHTASDPVFENVVAAACISSGSFDEVIYCSVCGVQMDRTTHTVPALGHDYHWSVTTEPTCIQTGIETGTCSRCNETDIRTVAASGHLLAPHEAQTTTCTEFGQNAYWDCTRCEKYFSDENGENEIAENSWVISATGHNTTPHPAVEATCTTAGNSAYWACDRCQKFFSDANGNDEMEENSWVIDALGHNMTPHAAVEATCTTAGNSAYWYCNLCGNFFSDENGNNEIVENSWGIDALGHNMTSYAAIEATCTTPGNTAYWHCDRCQKYFSDANGNDEIQENSWVINVLGHNMTPHTAAAATCTTAGNSAYWYCNQCQKYFSDANGNNEIAENSWVISALGHNMTPHDAVEASCTTDGNSAYWDCNLCQKYFSDKDGKNQIEENSWVILALGHNTTPHDAVNATCTTAGNSAYWSCTQCDKYFLNEDWKTEIQKDSWVISPLGHIEVTDETVAATCTETGLTEGKHCSRCNSVLTAQTTVDALGHDFGDWIQTTAPTCEKDGEETRYCSRCDAAETQPVNALGHNLLHHNPQAPTCTDIGWDAYDTCSRCDYSTYVKKDVLGHSYGEWRVTSAPTCTSGGVKIQTCTRCDSILTESIPALGHTLEHHDAVAATCTEDGNIEYWSCTRCEKYYSDAHSVNELSAEQIFIEANGHSPAAEVQENLIDCTCTSEGSYDKVIYCSVCHEILDSEHCIIPPSHKTSTPVEENVEPATCTEAGSHDLVIYCPVCHAETSRKTEPILPLGHQYDDPVFTWEDDGSECTATQICAHNPTHVKSSSVETTAVLVQPPTDTENGIARYTAVFIDIAFGTQETTLTIPALKDMNVIVLPEKLLSIDEYAFSGINAEAVIVPEGCLEIGAYAFAECEKLRYIRIPKSVTKIAENAFDGCRGVVLDIRLN